MMGWGVWRCERERGGVRGRVLLVRFVNFYTSRTIPAL